MYFLDALHRVIARGDLSEAESADAMRLVLNGEVSTPQLTAFLTALKMKGETVDEMTGFARAMREAAHRADLSDLAGPLVDTCGTGGDATGTFNISTVAAFVVAGAGARVAKHGNRSISSKFGSADLLEALGVRIAMTPEESAQAIRDCGIGFFFAPLVHPAMKHAGPARAELKMRTAFNLLGPLTNPARARAQLAGASSSAAAALIAGALARLGLARGLVVHGSDGMDEITTSGPTRGWWVGGDEIEVMPEDFGVPRATLSDLQTEDPVAAARAVLGGATGPHRDIVLVNASAALVVTGIAADWIDGVRLAAESIDSGAARAKLSALAAR